MKSSTTVVGSWVVVRWLKRRLLVIAHYVLPSNVNLASPKNTRRCTRRKQKFRVTNRTVDVLWLTVIHVTATEFEDLVSIAHQVVFHFLINIPEFVK